jgi:hypothetical protein
LNALLLKVPRMLGNHENHYAGSVAAAPAASESTTLKNLVQARKADLEAQLRALDSSNIERLLQEREETAVKLAELDDKIASLRQQLGLPARKTARAATGSRPVSGIPRTRMSSVEIRNRVFKALAEAKYGMSQKDISERASIPYGTVAAYLKANQDEFKTTGQLKGKRYFLK